MKVMIVLSALVAATFAAPSHLERAALGDALDLHVGRLANVLLGGHPWDIAATHAYAPGFRAAPAIVDHAFAPVANIGLATPSVAYAGAGIGLAGTGIGLAGHEIGLVGAGIPLAGPGIGLAGPGIGLAEPGIALAGPGIGWAGPGIGLGAPAIGVTAPSVGWAGPGIEWAGAAGVLPATTLPFDGRALVHGAHVGLY